jgi:hypothetical protein
MKSKCAEHLCVIDEPIPALTEIYKPLFMKTARTTINKKLV